jgi:hypothetical protein
VPDHALDHRAAAVRQLLRQAESDLHQAERELRDAETDLAKLHDRARRDGAIPGWFR